MQRADTRMAYRNQWLSVREDTVVYPDGSLGVYGVVEKPDFALVMPEDTDGRFCMVEQYRYPVGRRSWEFPQGSWSAADSGTPDALAAAELREETGLTADLMAHVGRLHPVYGFCTLAFDAFVATGLSTGLSARERSEQDMVQAWFTESEFVAMIRDGAVVDAASVAAYTLLLLARGVLPG